MKMNNPLMKELIRYCWFLALLCWVLAFMLMSVFKLSPNPPLVYSAFVGIRIFIQGMANVFILIALENQIPKEQVMRKRMMRYAGGYLFAIIFFVSTFPIEDYLTHNNWHEWRHLSSIASALLQGAINNSLVIFTQNLVMLRQEKANTDLENSRLKAANLESVNLLLKQQIHPHFLFNALSMLKSLYKSDLRAGEAYLTHLVNFLRASLAEPQSRVSRLSDEIKLCEDYVEMQKIRFEDALTCSINIPDSILSHGFVPSFSIQSLIENAIKHNEVTESSPLMIKVFYRNKRIITENNLQVRKYIEGRSGKGLINLVERYKILSVDEVIINECPKTFSVSIKVLSDEISHH
jgi:sensor histidine kinase YesM